MYLVRSLRTFIGTSTERTLTPLESFLPGDEFIETDTDTIYIHNGTAWLLNPGGSPGGSDTQIQFNDDGLFGGANLIYNKATGRFGVGTSPDSRFHVHESGGAEVQINYSSLVDSNFFTFARQSFFALNDAAEEIEYVKIQMNIESNTDGDEAASFGIYRRVGGVLAAVFLMSNTNSEIAGTLYVGDDLFVASGNIAKFESTGTVFNNSESDRDFRIAGNGVTNGYFYDGGLNRHGFGTGSPGAAVDIANTEVSGTPETGLQITNVYSPSSDPGAVFPQALTLLANYNSAITPSSGFQLAQFLDVRNSGNGVLSSRNLDIVFRNLGNGTVASVINTNIRTPVNSGGGAITTAYGLKVENQNIAGTNYAIYTDAGAVRFGDGVTIDTTTAALTVPRMTTTQQNALTAVNGMVIYNTSTNKLRVRAGGAWVDLH